VGGAFVFTAGLFQTALAQVLVKRSQYKKPGLRLPFNPDSELPLQLIPTSEGSGAAPAQVKRCDSNAAGAASTAPRVAFRCWRQSALRHSATTLQTRCFALHTAACGFGLR